MRSSRIGGFASSAILLHATGAGAALPDWLELEGAGAMDAPLHGREAWVERIQSHGPNWSDGRVSPDVAWQWEHLPAFGQARLRARLDSLELQVELPLRRDLDAWRRDPLGGNAPRGLAEMDINAPYEGWARWTSTSGARVTAGRFRQTFSWSEHGVVLGSDLRHDAILVSLPIRACTFESFWSGLDPWLVGVLSDGSIDSGSEADLQRTRRVENQKGRSYTDASKSLFFHRLTVHPGRWDLSIAEILVVGGKEPSLQEALPFVVWHNNFGDGYSKVSTALQARWSSERSGTFHAETVIEDVRIPGDEEAGKIDPRTIYGANLGWRLSPPAAHGGFGITLDGTVTSATLNNHTVPLLKGVSRRRYRSNHRDQMVPGFIDQWIVDQPLAYQRGSDAADLWSRIEWAHSDSTWGTGLEVDWLNQGDAAVWKDAELFAGRQGPLSGNVTSEGRILFDGWCSPAGRWWNLRAQAGLILLSEPDAALDVGPALSARLGWRL